MGEIGPIPDRTTSATIGPCAGPQPEAMASAGKTHDNTLVMTTESTRRSRRQRASIRSRSAIDMATFEPNLSAIALMAGFEVDRIRKATSVQPTEIDDFDVNAWILNKIKRKSENTDHIHKKSLKIEARNLTKPKKVDIHSLAWIPTPKQPILR